MSEAQEQSRSAWQQLEYEWQLAHTVWRDGTTDYFEANFVEPLAMEYHSYSRVLEEVMEAVRHARALASQQ